MRLQLRIAITLKARGLVLPFRFMMTVHELRVPAKEAEMPTDFEELKRKLLQSDEEFRQLATQHHDLDERIHNLAARHYLSEPEQSKKSPSRSASCS